MSLSDGSPKVKIGLIDGPIDFSHPDLADSNFRPVHDSDLERCKNSTSMACEHGTLVAGIMASRRGSLSPAICPNCTFLYNPIFSTQLRFPFSTPDKLASAITETVDAGADIINLSVSLTYSSIKNYSKLEDAFYYAISKKVLIVIVAGNQSQIGLSQSLNKINTILVSACDSRGLATSDTNLGGNSSWPSTLWPRALV